MGNVGAAVWGTLVHRCSRTCVGGLLVGAAFPLDACMPLPLHALNRVHTVRRLHRSVLNPGPLPLQAMHEMGLGSALNDVLIERFWNIIQVRARR